MDIAAAVAKRETAEQRRAELDARDTEHGGMRSIPELVAEQQAREAVRGWIGAYRAETSPQEVREIMAEGAELETRQERLNAATRRDGRRVKLERLWIDCRRAVARFAPAYRRDAAETLQSDALLLLLRWPSHGDAPSIDLGGADGLPWRRDWIETVERADGRLEQQLTRAAWRALHAAVKQAAESPAGRALLESVEDATDPTDIAALVEQQQRDTDAPTRLPDVEAPELVAELLDLSLDAGRAIVARAYPAATRRDLAESWGMAEQSVSNCLLRGAAAVQRRYPDSADLLDALEEMAPSYWERVQADAALALLKLAEQQELATVAGRAAAAAAPTAARAALAYIDAADPLAPRQVAAADAAADWRTVSGSVPMERRALLVSALAAARRHRIPVARAELIASSLPRLLRAEQRRARRQAGALAPLRVTLLAPAPALPANGSVAPETRANRVWSYGLTARDDRAERTIAKAEIVSRNGGDRRSAQRWQTRDPYPLGATRGGSATSTRARVDIPSKAQRRAALDAVRANLER